MKQPLTLSAQAILLHLHAQNGCGVPLGIPADVVPADQHAYAHVELATAGYIEDEAEALGGGEPEFCLTHTGLHAATTIKTSYPRQLWKRRILKIIREKRSAMMDDLHADTLWPGLPDEDTARRMREMQRDGLLGGQFAGGGGLFRAWLTSEGENCLDSGYGPEDYMKAPTALAAHTYTDNSITLTNSPSGVVNTGSGNATSAHNTLTGASPEAFDRLNTQLAPIPVVDETAQMAARSALEALAVNPEELTRGAVAGLLRDAYLAWGPGCLPTFTAFLYTLDG